MNRIAYINNQPHAFHEGETMLKFVKRVTGQEKMRYPRFATHPT